MKRSKRSNGSRIASKVLAGASMLAAVLFVAGCPPPQQEHSEGKTAVLLTSTFLEGGAKAEGSIPVPRQNIAKLYVTVEDVLFNQLTDSGSEARSALDDSVELDVAELNGMGEVLSASSLPVGHYDGGLLQISSARLAYTSAPDTFIPVALPNGGVLAFDADFTVAANSGILLALHLTGLEVREETDHSLSLETGLEFESNAVLLATSGDTVLADAVVVSGEIDHIDSAHDTLELKHEDHLDVDFAQAEILLPPLNEGGEPVNGFQEDLQEDDWIQATGSLVLRNGFVVLADSIQVDAASSDDDGDDDGDDDDDDDNGSGGLFDAHGNTSGFGIPNNVVGNAFAGETVWNSSCASCHPSPFGAVDSEPFDEIVEALDEVSQMSFLNLTTQQMADVTAYLNWDGIGTPPTSSVPSAPTGVLASDGTFSDKVAVTWNAAATATGYEVWRSATNDPAVASLLGSPGGTSYNDTTAVADVTYYYWVKATNAAGPSLFSAPDAGSRASVPPPPPSVPGAPANVQASDGTFADKVAVTWSASANATGYEVWRGTTGNSAASGLIGSPSGAGYDDTTAVAGTTYYYWVKATNSAGPSPFSAPDTGTRAAPPPAGPFDQDGNTTSFGIPSGFVGNITAGTTVWNNKCSTCHPGAFGPVGAFTYPAMAAKLSGNSMMSGIQVTTQQKADLTAYLNRP